MDGNGRWAKQRIMNRVKGHERGTETVRTIVRANRALNIPVLTLYAFSTENWQRSKAEVTALMAILDRFLKSERKEMMENDIRLNAIGQVDRLPNFVQKALEETMQATAQNRSMTLNLALSYGARNEIVRMVRAIAEKSISGDIAPEAITEQLVSEHLYTADFPDPDLLIRTSGEMRISNFLLWQIAYSEIFVTKTLWPDFSKEEYHKILKEYQQRDRRFGIA
jgi:undecaprenyl diphosphate synthase